MKKIFLIDDDGDIHKLLGKFLQDKYELQSALQGDSALEALRTQTQLPDLILLDVHMPNMSGTSFQKELSQDPRLKDLPIIYLSADNLNHDEVEHRFEFDFLNKPIDKDDLLAVLESFFKTQKR